MGFKMSLKSSKDFAGQTITEENIKLEKPRMYKVILHNDDYTPMEFVVEILVVIFKRRVVEATQIMLNVHNKGKAICGIYTFEIAETKVQQVHSLAEKNEFPLKATLEEA